MKTKKAEKNATKKHAQKASKLHEREEKNPDKCDSTIESLSVKGEIQNESVQVTENVDPNSHKSEDASSISKVVNSKSSAPKVSSAARRKELIEASDTLESFAILIASSQVYRLKNTERYGMN